jgi:hypothetical protein
MIRIGLRNVLIAMGISLVFSAGMCLFRDDWVANFWKNAHSFVPGLLVAASFWSAREGFEAGVRSVDKQGPA